MSEPPIPSPIPGDADPTAAEYVLGLLEGDDHRRAGVRFETDPVFRAEVEAWRLRFAPMIHAVAPVAPPAGLWGRIDQAIASDSAVVAFPGRRRIWNNLVLWRSATAASLAAAAASLMLVLTRPPVVAPALQPVQVATLSSPDGKPLFIATLDRARQGVTVVPVANLDSQGRALELWIIAPGGKPRAIGMLSTANALSVSTSRAVLADASPKAVMAVSLETAGGSPTGAPTGPVIATGVLVRL